MKDSELDEKDQSEDEVYVPDSLELKKRSLSQDNKKKITEPNSESLEDSFSTSPLNSVHRATISPRSKERKRKSSDT